MSWWLKYKELVIEKKFKLSNYVIRLNYFPDTWDSEMGINLINKIK